MFVRIATRRARKAVVSCGTPPSRPRTDLIVFDVCVTASPFASPCHPLSAGRFRRGAIRFGVTPSRTDTGAIPGSSFRQFGALIRRPRSGSGARSAPESRKPQFRPDATRCAPSISAAVVLAGARHGTCADGERRKTPGGHPAPHPDESLAAAGIFSLPDVGPATGAHSENASSVARRSGGEGT
jgi:hypothetical protein